MRFSTDSRAFLALLIVLSAVGPLTLNILMPSLPALTAALSAPKEKVQLTLSLYLAGMGVGQLVLGPLADRFGRRKVLLVGLTGYVLASIAAIFSPSVEILILARLAQSFGAVAGITLTRTMIRDLYPRDQAASRIAYVTMAMVFAPMLAPTIGAALDDLGTWRLIFAFCACLGAVALTAAFIALPETRPTTLESATGGEILRRTASLFRNRRYLGYFGAFASASGMFFAFLGAAPYLIVDVMGRSKAEYALWFMSLSLGYMCGNFISGRMAQSAGVDRLIFWGNLAGLVGGVTFMAVALVGTLSPALIFIPAMITSFANGLVLPNALAAGIGVDPKAQGAASGLMGFGQMGFGAVLTFLSGAIVSANALPLALMMLVCAVIGLVTTAWGRRPHPTIN